jgi:hypothetical protein
MRHGPEGKSQAQVGCKELHASKRETSKATFHLHINSGQEGDSPLRHGSCWTLARETKVLK